MTHSIDRSPVFNPAGITTLGSRKFEQFFGGAVPLDAPAAQIFATMGSMLPELGQGVLSFLEKSASHLPERIRTTALESLAHLTTMLGEFAPTIIELIARLEMKERFGLPVVSGAAEVFAQLVNDEGAARTERLTAAQRVEQAARALQASLEMIALVLTQQELALQAEIDGETARKGRVQAKSNAPGVVELVQFSGGIVSRKLEQLKTQKDGVRSLIDRTLRAIRVHTGELGERVLTVGRDLQVRMPNASKAIPVTATA